MSKIFSGKEVNTSMNAQIIANVQLLKSKSITPKIITFRVGENGADISYELSINKKFEKLGIEVENIVHNLNVEFSLIENQIKSASNDDSIHGIMIFQPLPKHLNFNSLRKSIEPSKDIDGSTYENIARLFDGTQYNAYCAPMAVIKILDYYNVDLEGKKVTIIGRGPTVGKPLSILMMNANATVTVCHSKSKNIKEICKSADILVSAMGKARIVDDSYVSENQIVIDVGTTFIEGKLYGDLNLDKIAPIVQAYTPTPNGVGAITTTLLAENTIKSALSMVVHHG